MTRLKIEVEAKRPASATPERIRELRAVGLTLAQIGRLYGITKQRVWQLSRQGWELTTPQGSAQGKS